MVQCLSAMGVPLSLPGKEDVKMEDQILILYSSQSLFFSSSVMPYITCLS